MISQLSEIAVDTIFSESKLSQDDRELYVYGFFMLFSKLAYFFLTIMFGILFGTLIESILFYIMFSTIRSFAGGVHASKESTCTIWTSLLLFISVASIKVCIIFSAWVMPLVLLLSGTICIIVLCPLDTEAKRLTDHEKRRYRRKSIVSLLLILGVAFGAFFAGVIDVFYSCFASIFLESILLMFGKITNTT